MRAGRPPRPTPRYPELDTFLGVLQHKNPPLHHPVGRGILSFLGGRTEVAKSASSVVRACFVRIRLIGRLVHQAPIPSASATALIVSGLGSPSPLMSRETADVETPAAWAMPFMLAQMPAFPANSAQSGGSFVLTSTDHPLGSVALSRGSVDAASTKNTDVIRSAALKPAPCPHRKCGRWRPNCCIVPRDALQSSTSPHHRVSRSGGSTGPPARSC